MSSFLEGEALRVGAHHELLAGAGEDEDLVLRVGADDLEHLAERALVLDRQLDRAAERVRLDQQDAVRRGAPCGRSP